jgi:hypothetical protein
MIETLASKSATGDLYVTVAKRHLSRHEWGLARQAVERALAKGNLSDAKEAHNLMRRVASILGTDVHEKRSV